MKGGALEFTGAKDTGEGFNGFDRMVGISHSLSKVLRSKGARGMQRDGFASMKELLRRPYMTERSGAHDGVHQIANGGGETTNIDSELAYCQMARQRLLEQHMDILMGLVLRLTLFQWKTTWIMWRMVLPWMRKKYIRTRFNAR